MQWFGLIWAAGMGGLVGYLYGVYAGMRLATVEVLKGVNAVDRDANAPLPKSVNEALDSARAAAAKFWSPSKRTEEWSWHLREIGREMGHDILERGEAYGDRKAQPKDGERRVDLNEKELRSLAFLADWGFKRALDGRMTIFRDKDDAHETAHAIERLDIAIRAFDPEHDADYNDSWNRQTYIFDRFR